MGDGPRSAWIGTDAPFVAGLRKEVDDLSAAAVAVVEVVPAPAPVAAV